MATFHLQIVTPEGLMFDDISEEIVVRTVCGDIGILAGHIPYMAPLGIGELRVKQQGVFQSAAVSGGFVSTDGKETQIICTTCEWAQDIDKDRAQKAKEGALLRLQEQQLNAQEKNLWQLKLKRAETRLRIAEKYQEKKS